MENVLVPVKVCTPVVTIPPKLALAGVSVKVVPLMVAPFTLEVPLIDPTEPTPPLEAVVQVKVPLPNDVKTCPDKAACVFGYVTSFNVKVPVVLTFVTAVVLIVTEFMEVPSAPH